MHFGSGGTTDEQRKGKSLFFHFGSHMRHFFKRRSDKPAEPNDIHLMLNGFFQNFSHGCHNTQVHHLVIIAAQHHPDYVFTDIVHITFHGSHQYFSGRLRITCLLFCFEVWEQARHSLFHDAGAFNDLRQEHFSGAEQIAHMIHTTHQWAFDDLERPCVILAGFIDINIDMGINTVHQ